MTAGRGLLGALALAGGVLLGAPEARAVEAPQHRARHPLHGTLNLNLADEDALELLPGIGETKAQRIVAFRKAHPFRRVEDLVRVRGFGRRTLSRLRPYLGVAGPTTLAEEPPAPATH